MSVPHRMLLGVKKKKSVMRFSKKRNKLGGQAGGRAQVRFSRADFNIGPVFDSRWKHISFLELRGFDSFEMHFKTFRSI